MALKDYTYTQGAMELLGCMGRLTVLRPALQEPPLQELYALLSSLLQHDTLGAAGSYHACCLALLTGGYRRVSGDLFRDFLYWLLLERENAFALQAAQNIWDEPLCAAMRGDLKQFSLFFDLNSVTIKRWIGECQKEQRSRSGAGRGRQQQDSISVLSSAVWGGQSRPALLPREPATALPAAATMPERPLDENELPSWRYQNDLPSESTLFAAESALEELYHRLNHAEDRGALLDDLFSFHAAYGAGAFIRRRLFSMQENGALQPIPAELLPAEDSYTFYQQQRDQVLQHAIRFMRGELAPNILLVGGPGTGKTSQVFSLCRELPDLRLITCAPTAYAALAAAIPRLMAQPLQFVLFLDDFAPTHPHWPLLKAAVSPAGMQPPNLLLIAAAQETESAFFALRVMLPPPQLKEFIELVRLLLLREGRELDFDSIQNACIDYAAMFGSAGKGASPLSFRSAQIIADGLAEG